VLFLAVLALAGAGRAQATLPGLDGEIVVAAKAGAAKGAHFDLYLVDPVGGAVTQLTRTKTFDEFWPSFSPDGTKIAFVGCACDLVGRDAQAVEHSQVYVVPTAGGQPRQVTRESGAVNRPSWSPDGKLILFDEQSQTGPHVYAVPAAGGRPVRLTSTARQDVAPELSPNGKRLAVFRTVLAPGTGLATEWLTVIDVLTGDARRIAGGVSSDDRPSWSPDGRTLAFARDAGRDLFDVETAGVSGSPLRQVTRGDGDKRWPVWSPDGTRLAYVTLPRESVDDGFAGTLTISEASGAGAHAVRGLPALAEQPDWQRQ